MKFGSPFGSVPAWQRQSDLQNRCNQQIEEGERDMSITNGFAGVSNCYVFKSRLQEYAQKAGFLTPVYETVKEGPSHQPCFRSTVIVDNVRYDSLPGFFNRKAAEQSAAEIALLELAKSGNLKESISYPVHETGLCKNLLQEYAQKMNYAIPSYSCRATEAQGKKASFSCTVDIGGIMYIGAAASSKKEAEIKAARTALLAIQSQSSTNGAEATPNGSRNLTVLPCKNKGVESDAKKEETAKPFKPKKANFKKKPPRKKFIRKKVDQTTGDVESCLGPQLVHTETLEATKDGHGGEHVGSQLNQNQQMSVTETNHSQNGQETASSFSPSDQGNSNMVIFSGVEINDLVTSASGGNKVTGVVQVANMGGADFCVSLGEKLVSLNQNEEGRKAVEAETVQRIGEQIQATHDLYQSVDFLPL